MNYELSCEEHRAETIEIFAELCELEDDLVEFVLDLEEYFFKTNTSECTNKTSCINNLPRLHNTAASCLKALATIHRVIEQSLFPSKKKEQMDTATPLVTPDFLMDCEFSNISTLKSILEKNYGHES